MHKHVIALEQDEIASIAEICGAADCHPHLATFGRDAFGRREVRIHTARSVGTDADRKATLRQLRNSGIDVRFKLRNHSPRAIANARSLEKLISAYGRGEYLFDPTGGFSRSAALVDFAKKVRAGLDDKVLGVYWESNWRTLYVVLDHRAFFRDEKVDTTDLATAEHAALEALTESCGAKSGYVAHLRLGFELPRTALVPVDEASYLRSSGMLARLAGKAKLPTAAMIGLGGAIAAGPALADGPAVSGLNGKIAIIGGWGENAVPNLNEYDNPNDDTNTNTHFLGAGSLTTPLTERFGVQIDGVIGRTHVDPSDGGDDADFTVGGVGGHIFWRDPQKGLFGVTGSVLNLSQHDDTVIYDDFSGNMYRVGVEGEIYLDQFTIAAAAGHQWGRYDDDISYRSSIGEYTNEIGEDGLYASIDFAWYATDNLRLNVGAGTVPSLPKPNMEGWERGVFGSAGVEWQPAINGFTGLTLFADGTLGEGGYRNIFAGVRFYFGDDKTLIARHREDDPIDNLPLDMLANGARSY